MSFRNILRKVFLAIALGGHSVLGVGMSREKIEELLYAMNQTRVEATIEAEGERLREISSNLHKVAKKPD